MMKNSCSLSLFGSLDEDAPAAKTLGVTHHDDLSFAISSKEDVLPMIQTVDTFVKNNYKSPLCYPKTVYRHARTVLDEVCGHHIKQHKEKFPTFALFLDTKIQHTKNIFHFILRQFTSPKCFLDSDARKNSEEVGDKGWHARNASRRENCATL